MLVTGVDENGLGPRLGPLVATSLTMEVPRYDRSALCERGLRLGLTDSKETGGFGRMELAESIALGLLAAVHEGAVPQDADGLLEWVFPEVRPRLRSCCPDPPTAAQCWSVGMPLPTFGGDPIFGRGLVERLVGRSRIRIAGVRSRIACAGVLNAQSFAGRNKLDVDLELFEDLIHEARRNHGGPLLVICGMIGGIRDYAARFARFDGQEVRPLRSRRGQRRYEVKEVGQVCFEVDADARHLPVALASIVGKYVREVCMRRIGEFYRRGVPDLALASGYHDPVTTRFIEATEASRRRLGIARDCFRRQA